MGVTGYRWGLVGIWILLAGGALAQKPVHSAGHPLSFYPNRGQAPAAVLWEAHGAGFDAAFAHDRFTLRVGAASQTLVLADSNPAARLEALDPLPGKVSFFMGRDSSRWVAGLPTYSRLRYRDIYPGIDLLFYGKGGALEYDFVLAPGADPARIRLRVDTPAHLTPSGELQLGAGAQATLHRPLVYQNTAAGKQSVEGRFTLLAGSTLGFRCGPYDRTRTLVIDPSVSLLYATYIGGLHDDEAYAIALDSQNNSYILGESASQDYPASANAYQSTRSDLGTYTYNMVLTKMSPQGVLLYSTFIGNGADIPYDTPLVAVDSHGNAWIGGNTNNPNYPVTANAYQSSFQTSQEETSLALFFTEISPDGSNLVYSSFFSGSVAPYYTLAGLAVNSTGQVYLAGEAAPGLPTTPNAYSPSIPAGNGVNASFVAVFNPALTGAAQLVACTYFGYIGGVNPQYLTLNAMALDASGNVWLASQTNWSTAPTTPNAIQPNGDFSSSLFCNEGFQGGQSEGGYVAKLSADMTTLLYATFLSGGAGAKIGSNPAVNEAGCDESITGAASDANGNLFLVGYTGSNLFPVSQNAYQTFAQDFGSGALRFVMGISSDGSQILFSTFLGGSAETREMIAPDGQDNAWVASNVTLPLTNNALQSAPAYNQQDGMLAQISADGTTLLFGTYLPQVAGGNTCNTLSVGGRLSPTSCATTIAGFAVDQESNAYVAGTVTGALLSPTQDAFQPQFANGDISPDGGDIFFTIIGGASIGALSTTTGGNNGDVTVTITGSGFYNGLNCSLGQQGYVAVYASSAIVNSAGTSITCTFALSGTSAGVYDVGIDYPDGSMVTDTGAFTVQNGGQPQIWTMLSGRSAIRVGTPSALFLNYGNSGTQDADLTTLWIALPSAYSFTIAGLTNPSDLNCPAIGVQPISFGSNGMTYIPLLVPIIPAGATNTLVITVTAPAVTTPMELDGYAEEPWFSSQASASAALSAAASAPATVPTTCVNGTGTSDCLGPQASEAMNPVAGYLAQFGITDLTIVNDILTWMSTDLAKTQNSAPPGEVLPWLLVFDQVAADIAANRFGVTGQCSPPFTPPNVDPDPDPDPLPNPCPHGLEWGNSVNPWGTDPCKQQQPVSSIDPNDKTGPDGDGSASQYIRPISPLVYTVAFENQASATAPAQQVVVTDSLDPTKVNLSSLALGNISFGTNTIVVPGSTNNFNTLFPLNSSLSVRIQGSLNTDTNTLSWTFSSIDPSTGLPPSDPTVGFLPPDADGVEGQGSVTFSLMPAAGLTTGTQITNQATVVFDSNSPIPTLSWLNTVDITPPVSSVTALPSTETQAAFTVSWSGTDVGSGIATYTIYVSDTGGPFTVFQNAVATTSASFPGQSGHTYGFFSIATDNAGNVQPLKTVADTSTTVMVSGLSGGPCDVRDYGTVTVGDVQQEINESMGSASPANDLNYDGVVNAADVQIVINAMLHNTCTR